MVGPSPHAFLVNGQVFFDPHPGVQLSALQRCVARVVRGEGPSKKFLYGNRGGGKSVMARKGLLHGLAMALPGLKYGVVRRNYPDLEKNHLIYVGREVRQLGGEWNETKRIARYENGSLGFYFQCEEEADVEKIVGAEVAVLFVDEAPQIKWDYLRTMAPSLRVPRGADGKPPFWTLELYGGNPIGESIEEIWKYFIDQDVDTLEDPEYDTADWEAIEIRLHDNPSLDPVEYRKQFAGLPAHYRKAWIDGVRMDARTLFDVRKTVDAELLEKVGETPRVQSLPVSMLGRSYHYIQELPTIDGVPLLRVPWIQVYRSYDHGFFPDPAAGLWHVVLGRRILTIAEGTWFREIAKDIAAKLIEQHRELVGEIPCAMTYVDPTIAVKDGTVTVMDTLEMNGVPCEASINDRVLYADAIHGLLGEEVEPGVPRWQLYEPGCPMLARYLPKMRWDEKNPRKMADHKFDHWVVALAYFAISSGVLSVTAKEEVTQEPVWMSWIREAQQRPRGRMRA